MKKTERKAVLDKLIRLARHEGPDAMNTLIEFILYIQFLRKPADYEEKKDNYYDGYAAKHYDLPELLYIADSAELKKKLVDNFLEIYAERLGPADCRDLEEIEKYSIGYIRDVIEIVNSVEDPIETIDDYQYLLERTIHGKRDGSTTPYFINKLMINLLDVHENETVLDPASGSGVSAMLASEKACCTYSIDVSPAAITRQNMVKSALGLRIISGCDDSLQNAIEKMFGALEFNKIICNPPFGVQVSRNVSSQARFIGDYEYEMKGIRNSDLYFYNLIAKYASEKSVFVSPLGFLYSNTNDALEFKKWLLRNNFLSAVIHLPARAFAPITGIETAIIVVDKNKTDENVMFVELDGSRYISQSRLSAVIEESKIDELTSLVEAREASDISVLVSNRDLLTGDLNLSVSKFIKKKEDIEEVNLPELIERRKELTEEFVSIYKEVDLLIDQMKGGV